MYNVTISLCLSVVELDCMGWTATALFAIFNVRLFYIEMHVTGCRIYTR